MDLLVYSYLTSVANEVSRSIPKGDLLMMVKISVMTGKTKTGDRVFNN